MGYYKSDLHISVVDKVWGKFYNYPLIKLETDLPHYWSNQDEKGIIANQACPSKPSRIKDNDICRTKWEG